MSNQVYDLVIIGGGTSGLMAASTDFCIGKKVLIIEKNDELGKKLKITGGGRCNIFNAESDTRKLLSHYGDTSKYLHSPFSIFGMLETKKYFESLGVYIKVEDRNRAFPTTEKASDVYDALYKKIVSNKVEIKLDTSIQKINLNNKSNKIESVEILNIKTNKIENIYSKKFILSTGGTSHSYTGSTGDGFKLLKELNIKINNPTASLVPVNASNKWVHNLSGKTLKNIKITFRVDGEKKKVLTNKSKDQDKNINILCTHFGLSGPHIINASKEIKDWLIEGEVVAHIDLFKDMNERELDRHILDVFDNNKNKKLKNILNDIYPDNILEQIFLDKENILSKINLDKEVNEVNREERVMIVNELKNLKVIVTSLASADKSIVADGGVDVSEINFQNFSLNKIPNLHVTGDMLDIARPSGGYSLQLCWTSGYIAAREYRTLQD